MISAVLSIGAGVTIRHAYRSWQAWIVIGGVTLVAFLVAVFGGSLALGQAGLLGVAGTIGGIFGREIFDGFTTWSREFLGKNFGWIIGIGVIVVLPYIIGADKAAKIIGPLVGVLAFFFFFNPARKKKKKNSALTKIQL